MTYPENLQIIRLDSIDSSNDYLKRNYLELSHRFPVMIQTETQTKGRGRSGRHWCSPGKKGLYISFGFSLNNKTKLSLLPLATGIAIVEVMSRFVDERVFIKWPNDIICKDRKLAGILTETIIYGDMLTCISGIGINVNQTINEFPLQLQQAAISLKIISGRSVSIKKLEIMLARTFFNWIEKLENGQANEITRTMNQLCIHSRGDRITFHEGDRTIQGIFNRIGDDGGLVMQSSDGTECTYYSGEIQMNVV